MKKILLKTATKKRYLQIFDGHTISDKREDMWINRLTELLNLTPTESNYDYNSLLEILAFQTACFMEDEVLEREDNLAYQLSQKPSLIIKYISAFNDPEYTFKDLNSRLTQEDIIYFFSYYLYFNNTWENFDYSSKEEKAEILTYRKLYIDTFTLWELARGKEENVNIFESDIRYFALALYRKEYLPDPQKYIDSGDIPDDIVELCTSFIIDNSVIIKHDYTPT